MNFKSLLANGKFITKVQSVKHLPLFKEYYTVESSYEFRIKKFENIDISGQHGLFRPDFGIIYP